MAATQTRSAILSLDWVTSQENMVSVGIKSHFKQCESVLEYCLACIKQILLGLTDGKVKVYNVSSQKVTSDILCGQNFPRLVAAL